MVEQKKLYRSQNNRMISGICAGIAEYFEIDPTLVRVIWVVFSVAGGAGVIAYIVAHFIVPERPFPRIKCVSCGNLNEISAEYCRQCGQKLETSD
ncbi:MAG: PspC domain-containing protein [Candidatus Bathyarchaeota archaeon]